MHCDRRRPRRPSTPARVARAAWAASAAAAAGTAAAAEGSPGAGLGPWLFGCLALLLVGAGGLSLGAARERARRSPMQAPERPVEPVVDAPALADIVAEWPTPALLVRRAAAAAGWRIEACNAAASALLPTVGGLPRWPAALPPALAGALDAGPAEERGRALGWCWRRFDGRDGAAWLLVHREADRADERDRLDSEEFSFTVAHDLRAPVRVVDGFARILKEDYGAQLDRVAADHLERVLGAAARMNSMIDAMLSIARLGAQPLARQPVDLSRLAALVVEEMRRAQPERAVEVRIAPGLHAVGDPTQLRLVLENLLGNAWKYTARVDAACIEFGTEPGDAGPVFFVRDNGAGFDMRAAERLFGLFQRLHSASEFAGTGVGLASVRRIVRRHGGDVWAEGVPDRGATFRFRLGA
ncbi:MAG: ATP-binding protein [Rubrivivax sp.]|jgi:signal transduction histidine kinase|nr:ATP-binding protein [Rubrivivax sp.]